MYGCIFRVLSPVSTVRGVYSSYTRRLSTVALLRGWGTSVSRSFGALEQYVKARYFDTIRTAYRGRTRQGHSPKSSESSRLVVEWSERRSALGKNMPALLPLASSCPPLSYGPSYYNSALIITLLSRACFFCKCGGSCNPWVGLMGALNRRARRKLCVLLVHRMLRAAATTTTTTTTSSSCVLIALVCLVMVRTL